MAKHSREGGLRGGINHVWAFDYSPHPWTHTEYITLHRNYNPAEPDHKLNDWTQYEVSLGGDISIFPLAHRLLKGDGQPYGSSCHSSGRS